MIADFGIPPGCEGGVSGHCGAGHHGQCAHRLGGLQQHGSWSPECYVSIGLNGGVPPSLPMVVRPSHVWRCSCSCHCDAEPTDLFELLSMDGVA